MTEATNTQKQANEKKKIHPNMDYMDDNNAQPKQQKEDNGVHQPNTKLPLKLQYQ